VTGSRRVSQRFSVVLPAKLTVDEEEFEVIIDNISLGGCQIVFNQRLSMGQRVSIEFQLPKRTEIIRIGATVRWTEETSTGLQFEGLRARDVWVLNQYFGAAG
jgi:c-di-GMP-binding flagellar brake protein YcgR